jgi:hypothetical protein
MLYPNEPIITESRQHLYAGHRGLVPRSYATHPVGTYEGEVPFGDTDIEEISESEFPERIKELEDTKSRLSDIRMTGNNGQPIPSLNQSVFPYCWAFSGTSCNQVLRAQAGLEYVKLSGTSVAATIKNGRREGGWGAQGLDFINQRGEIPDALWPELSGSLSHGTAANWQVAKKYRITEGFANMNVAQYDRRLTFRQVITCLIRRIPVICDFNWWGHSVAGLDPVNGASQFRKTRDESSGKLLLGGAFDLLWGMNDFTGGIAIRILNSWADSWGSMGMAVLTTAKSVPDGATAPRLSTMSFQPLFGFKAPAVRGGRSRR